MKSILQPLSSFLSNLIGYPKNDQKSMIVKDEALHIFLVLAGSLFRTPKTLPESLRWLQRTLSNDSRTKVGDFESDQLFDGG